VQQHAVSNVSAYSVPDLMRLRHKVVFVLRAEFLLKKINKHGQTRGRESYYQDNKFETDASPQHDAAPIGLKALYQFLVDFSRRILISAHKRLIRRDVSKMDSLSLLQLHYIVIS